MAMDAGNSFSDSKEIKYPGSKGMDQGAAIVSPDGNTIYFTRWITQNNIKLASVYISTRTGDEWSEPKALGKNVNVEGYSSMQPFVTTDSKYLLFASNWLHTEEGTISYKPRYKTKIMAGVNPAIIMLIT